MNKSWKIFLILGFLCLFSAFGLVVFNQYEDVYAGTKSRDTYTKIIDIFNNGEKIPVEENIEPTEMPTKVIDGYEYIGVIAIPSLNLELPVMSDWNYSKMKISPCRYYGSLFTNDLVICAHAYKSFFGNIKKLKYGDKLIFTDMNQNQYIYEVQLVEVLKPTDIDRMIDSEFDLTLYTCTSDGLNRITVRLNRI